MGSFRWCVPATVWPLRAARTGEIAWFAATPATPSTLAGVALHGRTIEQARIAALLDDVRGGHSGVLVVRGEPGAGKSSLLEAAVAGAEGMHVVRGAGVEAEAPLAYAVLHQMLWPWRERSASIPAPQRHALRIALGLEPGTAADRFLVSAAVLSLLGALAETRPVLCAVDDVQWVDPASGDARLFAARRLMAEQVAIVFALRDGEAGRFDAPGLPELTLGPLDPSAARELLAEAAGTAVVPAVASRLVEATGGNPLALAEIGPLLDAEHLSGLAPLPDPLPLGAGVERAYTARAHALPETTQTALLVAAIEARGDLDTVLAATGTLGADPAALDPAEQAGLVSTGSGRLRFRHPLVRSAVAQAAPFGRRRAAHLALAATLADQDDDRAVWHHAGAAVGPDPGLAEELVAAAARSRTRAPYSS